MGVEGRGAPLLILRRSRGLPRRRSTIERENKDEKTPQRVRFGAGRDLCRWCLEHRPRSSRYHCGARKGRLGTDRRRPHVPHDHPLRRAARSGRSSSAGRRPRPRTSASHACGCRRTTIRSPGPVDRAGSGEGSDGIASALASPDQLIGPAAGCGGGRHPGDHAQLGLERLPGDRRAHARRPDRVHRRPGCGRAVQRARRDQDPVRSSGRVERGARGALRRPRRHVRG